jgi:Icc-related predicted phosphoesterase
MRIVCMSDTHGRHRRLTVPDGDLLIHAGDITRHGHLDELDDFNLWLGSLPHRHKVLIAGNHDFCFQEQPWSARGRITNATYLEDSSTEINGLTIYGSPWQPFFGGWAFNLHRGEPLAEVWARIPDDTDILVTHGPPQGILDRNRSGDLCGCRDLLVRLMELRPRLHVFGHIHESAGRLDIHRTTFVNSSVAPGPECPLREPIVVELG